MLRRVGAAADLRAFLRLKGWGGDPERLPPASYYQSAAILTHFAYRWSREEDEARKILDEVVESHWFQPDDWPYSIIRYLRREIDANALFAAAINDQKKMAEVQAYIGLDLALSSRPNDAIPHLRWASVNGPVLSIERDLALSELQRIDRGSSESPISARPAVVTDRLHVLMIIEDDTYCGPSFEIDAELLSRLLALQIDRKRVATPVVLRQSKGEVTREMILSAAQKLDVRASDAILCFYAGLGVFDQSRNHYLALPDGSNLPRAELLNSLKAKNARLTVLMTDCCLDAMPPGGEILVLNPPGLPSKVLFWLLFGQKGIVDINSSAPGEVAFCLQDVVGAQGSIFMRSFVKDCTLGSFAGKRKVPWDDFFGQLKKTVGLTYRMEKKLTARNNRVESGQAEQNPYAAAIKTEWDVPPNDEKKAPPTLGFPNDMPRSERP